MASVSIDTNLFFSDVIIETSGGADAGDLPRPPQGGRRPDEAADRAVPDRDLPRARHGGRAGRGGRVDDADLCGAPRPRRLAARREPPDLETRFKTLVQSPLRAGILRFLSARPGRSLRQRQPSCRRSAACAWTSTTASTSWSTSASSRRSPGDPPTYGAIEARAGDRRQAARHLPRGPRQPRHRGIVAVGAALPRDDRPRREDARHLRVDSHRRRSPTSRC